MIGLGVNRLGVNRLGTSTKSIISPSDLFKNGEAGTYSDIRTYATNYYSDDGVTPAELEDPIYRITDQSGNGLDWVQGTATARPRLSARYNLVEKSKDLSTFALLGTPVVTANATTAPDGTLTADRFEVSSGQSGFSIRTVGDNHTSGVARRVRVAFKKDGISGRLHFCRADRITGYVDLDTLETTTQTIAEFVGVSTTVEADVDGWWIMQHEFIPGGSGENRIFITGASPGDAIYLVDADNRLASDTDQPAYQRVGDLGADPRDYDAVGFDPRLIWDNGDDTMTTDGSLAAGTYTVVLSTREGIFFDEVTHAGGAFTVGPTSYTGGPAGIMGALATGTECHMIGPPLIVPSLTAAQQSAVVQWLQNRGAGVELELGPELVSDGAWVLSAGWSVSSGVLTAASAAPASRSYVSDPGYAAENRYFVTYSASITSGAVTDFGTPVAVAVTTGSYRAARAAAANTRVVDLRASSTLDASFSSVSARKLQPKGGA